MSSSVAPSFLQGYWQDIFNLKQHLQEFLNSYLETIEQELALGQQSFKEIGHRDFDWKKLAIFIAIESDKLTYLTSELGICPIKIT